MATTKYKFDIFKLIEQIDRNNYQYVLNLSDEDLKNIQPFIIQRYFSSAPSQSGLNRYFLIVASDINRDMWKCNDKKLNLLMMAAAGTGRKEYHSWIKSPTTKTKPRELEEIVKKQFNLRDDEVKLFFKINEKKTILKELSQYGYDTDSIK